MDVWAGISECHFVLGLPGSLTHKETQSQAKQLDFLWGDRCDYLEWIAIRIAMGVGCLAPGTALHPIRVHPVGDFVRTTAKTISNLLHRQPLRIVQLLKHLACDRCTTCHGSTSHSSVVNGAVVGRAGFEPAKA